MNLDFTFEFQNCLGLLGASIVSDLAQGKYVHCLKLNMFMKLGHFTLLLCRGRKEMYKDVYRTYTATVLLIKPVWWLSPCRCRCGLLKLFKCSSDDVDILRKIYTCILKGQFTRYDFVACNKLTTGIRYELFLVNQTYYSLMIVLRHSVGLP